MIIFFKKLSSMGPHNFTWKQRKPQILCSNKENTMCILHLMQYTYLNFNFKVDLKKTSCPPKKKKAFTGHQHCTCWKCRSRGSSVNSSCDECPEELVSSAPDLTTVLMKKGKQHVSQSDHLSQRCQREHRTDHGTICKCNCQKNTKTRQFSIRLHWTSFEVTWLSYLVHDSNQLLLFFSHFSILWLIS